MANPERTAADAAPVPALSTLLADAREALGQRADVLHVRLGWLFRDGWITDQRALVVTVAQKLTPAELHAAGHEPLPETFQGLPVEVTGPTPEDLLRLVDGPARAEAVLADARDRRAGHTVCAARCHQVAPLYRDHACDSARQPGCRVARAGRVPGAGA